VPTESIPSLATGAISTVAVPPQPQPQQAPLAGVAAQLGSSLVSQTGAGLAAAAITSIGAPAVVAVRQLVAAAVLLPIARPRISTLTRRQLLVVAALGCVTVTMNLGLYIAIDRIGLALAVTLEFLGPLGVAVAGSKHAREFVAAAVAAVGVVVLVHPSGSTDWVGIGCALGGAASWAAYILLNRVTGQLLPGAAGPAMSASVSAVLALPALVVILVMGGLTVPGVLLSVAAGVLCSVVPMAADVYALRRLTPRAFGILASVNPVAATLVALLLLRQVPELLEVLGIGLIVAANVLASVPRREASRVARRRRIGQS
jgi:inner membrane transporter RhtA